MNKQTAHYHIPHAPETTAGTFCIIHRIQTDREEDVYKRQASSTICFTSTTVTT